MEWRCRNTSAVRCKPAWQTEVDTVAEDGCSHLAVAVAVAVQAGLAVACHRATA